MNEADASAAKAVWNAYCEALKQAGEEVFRATTPGDPLTIAEGLRYLSRLSRIGLEGSVEFADPDFPVITRMVDETRKFGCDNPDTIYQKAVLNGAHSYLIRGRRGTVDYLSFTSNKNSYSENGRSIQTGFLDSKSLKVAPDGSFTITLSVEPADGNWLPMEPETRGLSIRQTFLDRRVEKPAELSIERLGEAGAPAPLSREKIEAGLKGAAGFALNCARLFTNWSESYLAHPNALPPADQAACLAAGGDPNIYFYRSFWQLAPDEALIVHVPRLPPCDTWNLQVDNYWQESMDYRYHRSHVNKHTAVYNADGSMTAVIAHADAGVPNWLDTAGHALGHFAMRYVRAATPVDPVTRLCKARDIAAARRSLAAG